MATSQDKKFLQNLETARQLRRDSQAGLINISDLQPEEVQLLHDLEAHEAPLDLEQYKRENEAFTRDFIRQQDEMAAAGMTGHLAPYSAGEYPVVSDGFTVVDTPVSAAAPSPSPVMAAGGDELVAALNQGANEIAAGARARQGSGAVAAGSSQRSAGGAPRTQSRASARRVDSAGSAGKSLEEYGRQLDRDIENVLDEIKNANKTLREYDQESEKFPGESKDLQLMRALSDQLKNEGGRSYSNVAAQLAMIEDKNFANVFDRTVNRRINAARKHFGRLGNIQRLAQGEKAAFRASRQRGRQRSEGYIRALNKKLQGLIDERNRRVRDVFLEGGRDRRQAAGNQARILAAAAGRQQKNDPLVPMLATVQNQIDRTQKQLDALNDPANTVNKQTMGRIAESLGLPVTSNEDAIKKRLTQRINSLQNVEGNLLRPLEQQGATRVFRAPVELGATNQGAGKRPAGDYAGTRFGGSQ